MPLRIAVTFFLAGCLGQSRDRRVTAAVSVTGMKQISGVAALGSASLQVTCTDGTADKATALDANADPVSFTPVTACGAAHLVLTANARSPNGPVTAYVGTADAKLVAGTVPVTFSGPLYGEVDFSSGTGQTFVCDGAPQSITVSATALVVPLPVGTYTLTCSAIGAATFSQVVVVTAGTRSTVSLPPKSTTPPALPGDATLANLIPAFGALSPAFDPAIVSYDLLLSSRRSQISFHTPANNPLATVAVSAPGTNSQPVSLGQGATDIAIAVTSADTTASKTYVVHATRGLVTDIELGVVISGNGVFSPATFSWDQPLYLFNDYGATDTISAAISGPTGVQLSIAGGSVTDGVPVPIDLPLGLTVVTLEASAPAAAGAEPETDSYWIKAQNAAGPYGMIAVLSGKGDQVGLQAVSDGDIFGFNGAASSQPTTADPVDVSSPVSMAANADGSVLYVSGTPVSSNSIGGNIGWFGIDDPSKSLTGGNNFLINASFGPTLLATDPKERFLYAGNVADGAAGVYSFAVDAVNGGVVKLLSTQTVPGTSICALTVDPLGRFLYAAFGSDTQNGIAIYWLNPDGTLEPIQLLDTQNLVSQLAVSTQGDALTFADGGNLQTFIIDSLTGALTPAAQVASIDASAGLGIFEGLGGSPFVTIFAGGNVLLAEFGAGFALGSVTAAINLGSFSVVVDSAGQAIYYIDACGGLSSQNIPRSMTDSFTPASTDAPTLPVTPSQIIYIDGWRGITAG